MLNNLKSSMRGAFRNACYLYFPYFMPFDKPASQEIMTGVLPGTSEWYSAYPSLRGGDLDGQWQKFKRRHDVAKERAKLFRDIVKNETAILRNNENHVLISLRRPEISFAGCVGASLVGSGINYMDIVGIYPRTAEPIVNVGDACEVDQNGTRSYSEFSIGIGDGMYLGPDDLVALQYGSDVMDSALQSCPEHLKEWASGINKLRRLAHVDISSDGEVFLRVSAFRGKGEVSYSHSIDHISGRAFIHYSRGDYENRIDKLGLFEELSFAGKVPDLLRPDCNWDKVFSSFSKEEREIAERVIFFGEECLDSDIDAESIRFKILCLSQSYSASRLDYEYQIA